MMSSWKSGTAADRVVAAPDHPDAGRPTHVDVDPLIDPSRPAHRFGGLGECCPFVRLNHRYVLLRRRPASILSDQVTGTTIGGVLYPVTRTQFALAEGLGTTARSSVVSPGKTVT